MQRVEVIAQIGTAMAKSDQLELPFLTPLPSADRTEKASATTQLRPPQQASTAAAQPHRVPHAAAVGEDQRSSTKTPIAPGTVRRVRQLRRRAGRDGLSLDELVQDVMGLPDADELIAADEALATRGVARAKGRGVGKGGIVKIRAGSLIDGSGPFRPAAGRVSTRDSVVKLTFVTEKKVYWETPNGHSRWTLKENAEPVTANSRQQPQNYRGHEKWRRWR